MQNEQENDAGGAAGAPDFTGVEGFVGGDEETEEQDARAQDAQPVEVEIPTTYHWVPMDGRQCGRRGRDNGESGDACLRGRIGGEHHRD